MTLELCSLEGAQDPLETEPELTPARHALNVLVVDDHPANRLLMCQQLGFLGHRHSTAHNGAQALEAWRTGQFDLLIVDCNMPVMNGYELTRAIRDHEAGHQAPRSTILGFTANAQPEERNKCLEAGMDDCLFKPISLMTLSRKLAEMPSSTHDAVFSIDGLNALTGGEPQLVKRLMDELLSSCKADREELQALPQAAPPQRFVDLAHKVKGAARIVQANTLVQHCETLEQQGRQLNPAQLEDARQAIVQALHELEAALQAHASALQEKNLSPATQATPDKPGEIG